MCSQNFSNDMIIPRSGWAYTLEGEENSAREEGYPLYKICFPEDTEELVVKETLKNAGHEAEKWVAIAVLFDANEKATANVTYCYRNEPELQRLNMIKFCHLCDLADILSQEEWDELHEAEEENEEEN